MSEYKLCSAKRIRLACMENVTDTKDTHAVIANALAVVQLSKRPLQLSTEHPLSLLFCLVPNWKRVNPQLHRRPYVRTWLAFRYRNPRNRLRMGRLPQDNTWCDTWEEFFTRGLKHMLALEETVQGPSDELEELSAQMYDKVIPRLLRPLDTGDRRIKPCIIHGDLWYGNATMDTETDEPLIFDACAFWGHNEYEASAWRQVRTRFGRHHMRVYHKHFPVSAPQEDWDDRNALYSIRYNLHSSALYPGRHKRNRDMVIEEMRRLVAKYPEGYEGYEEKDATSGATEETARPQTE